MADFHHWFSLFSQQILQTTLIEWLAVGFGVAEVLLARKNNILLYPTGIISILLSMFLLWRALLYAEMLLNIYYLVMSLYGWLLWKKHKGLPILKISKSSNNDIGIAVLISIGGFILLYLILHHYTNSDVPVFDAFVSSVAWAGMWLLAKRKVENWLFLNVSNFVAVPLLVHKGLFMFAVLTIFLFIIAVLGYRDWKKEVNEGNNHLSLA